jgi:hypothetical protein
VASTLQKAIQNPGSVSKYTKELEDKLTEPPDGLCKMLKNAAKNYILHKVLPETKPFIEEAIREYAGLGWAQVEDIVVTCAKDQTITLADLKEARKNPKVIVERLVEENIIELLGRVLEPIIQSDPELHDELKLSWPQIKPVLMSMVDSDELERSEAEPGLNLDELIQGLKNPKPFVQTFVQNHLPELLRPTLEPVFASMDLAWDSVVVAVGKVTMGDCRKLLQNPDVEVKQLVKAHIFDLLSPILQPLVDDNPKLRELGVDWAEVKRVLDPHSR